MRSRELTQGIIRAVLQLTGIALTIWVLYQLKTLIIYIAIAVVVSLIGRPIKRKLMRFRLGNLFATATTIVLLLGILYGILSMFVPLLLQQGENLSLLDVNALKSKIQLLIEQMRSYFNLKNSFWEEQISAGKLFKNIDISVLPEFINQILEVLSGVTIGLFSVLFITFFLLKDSRLLGQAILVLVNDKAEAKVDKSFEKIKNLLSRYFLGLLLQITILVVIYSTVLILLGIENAFIIAFLCALLNLIPYVGPVIGGILMLLLTMSSDIEADFSAVVLPKTTYAMIGFAIGQLVDNFFSQPFIFSNSVKSHPLEIFIVILGSGSLFGPMGMIVAIPTYTAVKVILKEFLYDNKIVKSLTKNL